MHRADLTRRAILAGLASAAAAVTGSKAAPLPPSIPRSFVGVRKAAWVWDFSLAQARSTAEAADRLGITTLFVSIPEPDRKALLAGDAEAVASLATLSAKGHAVWALTGDPHWVERPDELAAPLRQLLAIQAARGGFAGLQLDIEPHALPAWREGRSRQRTLVHDFTALLAHIRASAKGLPIDLAVHPMLASLPGETAATALAEVASHAGSVSIMAYRARPEMAMALAGPSIAVLEAGGTPWRLGVLTHATNEAGISLHGLPPTDIARRVTELDDGLHGRRASHYRGIAIEDLKSLREAFALV